MSSPTYFSNALVRPHYAPRVSYFHNEEVGTYQYGEDHPMQPIRLFFTHELVREYGLLDKMKTYVPKKATREELAEFHAPDYLEILRGMTPENEEVFPEFYKDLFHLGGDNSHDCPPFPGMFDFCSLYSGASLEAARKLNAKETEIAINWSGGLHHAKRRAASGFCYVNDIVLAINELLKCHQRVLYVDIDVHHGDGVQAAFYKSSRVMTVSFHQWDGEFFPGTGTRLEAGEGEGTNYSVNVPISEGIEDNQYHFLFKHVLRAVIEHFGPNAIVLQCGADSLGRDAIGKFNLSIRGHGECVRYVKDFNIPTLVLGGGGYTVENVARCWAYETAVLLDEQVGSELPDIDPSRKFFRPGDVLHPDLSGVHQNKNSRALVEYILRDCMAQLNRLPARQSVNTGGALANGPYVRIESSAFERKRPAER